MGSSGLRATATCPHPESPTLQEEGPGEAALRARDRSI